MGDIQERISALLATGSRLLDREEACRMSLLALAAGEGVFLYGPPGTAKSMTARWAASLLSDSRFFSCLLNQYTQPDELFGPVSLKAIEEGRREVLTAGYMPEADVSFLDEIWKAGPAILNTLLSICNEKKFRNGADNVDVPLKLLVSASNEFPDPDSGLDALYDRFLVRLCVSPVSGRSNFIRLLDDVQEEPSCENPVTAEELEEWKNGSALIPIPEEISGYLYSLRLRLRERGIYVSDRRWKKTAGLLRTSAFLNGRKSVGFQDLLILECVLWSRPEERRVVKECAVECVDRECVERSFSFVQRVSEAIALFEGKRADSWEEFAAVSKKLDSVRGYLNMLKGEVESARSGGFDFWRNAFSGLSSEFELEMMNAAATRLREFLSEAEKRLLDAREKARPGASAPLERPKPQIDLSAPSQARRSENSEKAAKIPAEISDIADISEILNPSTLHGNQPRTSGNPSTSGENLSRTNENPSTFEENQTKLNGNSSTFEENQSRLNENPSVLGENPSPTNKIPSAVEQSRNPESVNPSTSGENLSLTNEIHSTSSENPSRANGNPSTFEENQSRLNENPSVLGENQPQMNRNSSTSGENLSRTNENPSTFEENQTKLNGNPSVLSENQPQMNINSSISAKNSSQTNGNPSVLGENLSPTNEILSAVALRQAQEPQSRNPESVNPSTSGENLSLTNEIHSTSGENLSRENGNPSTFEENQSRPNGNPSILAETPSPTNGNPSTSAENQPQMNRNSSTSAENQSRTNEIPSTLAENQPQTNENPSTFEGNQIRPNGNPSVLGENLSRMNGNPSTFEENQSRPNGNPSVLGENQPQTNEESSTSGENQSRTGEKNGASAAREVRAFVPERYSTRASGANPPVKVEKAQNFGAASGKMSLEERLSRCVSFEDFVAASGYPYQGNAGDSRYVWNDGDDGKEKWWSVGSRFYRFLGDRNTISAIEAECKKKGVRMGGKYHWVFAVCYIFEKNGGKYDDTTKAELKWLMGPAWPLLERALDGALK